MRPYDAGPSQPSSSETLFPGFPTLDVGRLVRSVRDRLWLVALVIAAFLGLALAYVFLAPRTYQSSAVIYVDPRNEGAVFEGLKGVKQASWESLDALKSMAQGIQDSAVILRVVDRLELREDPDLFRQEDGPPTDADVVELFSEKVGAELRRGTRLIDISVRDTSPERARRVASALIEEFQALIRDQNRAAAAKSREKLEEEAESQLERVTAAENRLQEFRLEHPEISFDEDRNFDRKRLEDLEEMLASAGNDLLLRKAEFEQWQAIPEDDIERVFEIGGFGSQEHVQKLLLARNQKRAELNRIEKQFKPGHSTYEAYRLDLEGLEEQVDQVALGIGESIEKAYERAVTHEKQLKDAVRAQKKQLVKVEGVRKEYRTLRGAVDAAFATYQRLLDRANDSDVTKGIDETVIRTFSEPLAPSKPVSPRKKLTVAGAGVFGTFCGLGLVIALGLLDRRLHTRQQVESTLGLAVLTEIPETFNGRCEISEALPVTRDPGSMVSEGFRSLRTALSAHSPRSVLVTSASPGEGKSFCAANLAVLQANMGYRTLLVDADFRRPRMAEIFLDPRVERKGEAELATQNLCQPTIYPELYLLSCGRYTSNTGEPMSGEIFARMLHESYGSFDCVIIDTSPVNVVSDGLTYARHADAVALVVRAGETKADAARHAKRELQRMRANLVGCVLNGGDGIHPSRTAYVESSTRFLDTSRGAASRDSRPAPAAGSASVGSKTGAEAS